MPRRKTPVVYGRDEDSLSDEVDDDTEDAIVAKSPKVIKSDDSVLWIEKYAPRNAADICMNPRKVKDISAIMTSMFRNGETGPRLLILSGPSGCGKSTAVKVLAQQITGSDLLVEYRDSVMEGVSFVNHFSDFLDGCKYLTGSHRGFILIEELPNVFHEDTLLAFRRALQEWIYTDRAVALPPVVLCITEVEFDNDDSFHHFGIENSVCVETLLGKTFLTDGTSSGLVHHIKVLPIAKSFMKKTLQKIVSKEPTLRRKPSKAMELVLLEFYEAGDIRSAICNLQFWSTHGQGVIGLRESQISFFHAVGKIIHSSSKYSNLDHDESDNLSVNEVVSAYGNFDLLFLGLLENYAIYNGGDIDISIAAELVDKLSINDTLTGVEESAEYGVAGVRGQLRQVKAKPGRAQAMKFPRQFKANRELRKTRLQIANYVRYVALLRLSFQEANLVDGYLRPEIYNSFYYKLKHGGGRFRYNRLGGQFKEIYADEDVATLEELAKQDTFVAKDQFMEDIEQAIKQRDEEDQDEEEDLSDAIEESGKDTDEDDFNDLLDDGKINQLMRHMTRSMRSGISNDNDDNNDDGNDGFSDDPELDLLVSQGRL